MTVKIKFSLVVFYIIVSFCGIAWSEDAVRYADLGDFRLENGDVIRNCRVGYLISGELNAGKSNAMLVPTWLAGTSRELADLGFIGPGKVFDNSKYCVIAVDAFANGLSSSPSNSATQKGKSFPRFSIRDLVRAQHLLLTRHLNIPHVRAVTGISMGAMTTFQWMVSYPDFMDMAIPIEGSPWMSSYELLFFSAQLGILENVGECKGSEAAMKILAPLHVMHAWGPDYRRAHTSVADFPGFLADSQARLARYNADNWAHQVMAIMDHDITQPFGGNRQNAAAAVRARCLVITSAQDQMVGREEAHSFARLIGAPTADLNGACGHFAFFCDRENLQEMVNAFLSGQEQTSSREPTR
ncbi:alpha/beta fold hydrolase [Desulfatirhabdium butyrativorans]|uniref:alpha/beta fold hydrolase n=1 Tax=Desulfatirhabdium butyrativorans TaxID=340467 RepID=UPI000423A2CF|nr:alpha/beta fold hydrolase [Desulfatirhabdium butyrativorans]